MSNLACPMSNREKIGKNTNSTVSRVPFCASGVLFLQNRHKVNKQRARRKGNRVYFPIKCDMLFPNTARVNRARNKLRTIETSRTQFWSSCKLQSHSLVGHSRFFRCLAAAQTFLSLCSRRLHELVVAQAFSCLCLHS